MNKSKLPEDLRNSRYQLNFEVDGNGNLIKHPTTLQLSNYMEVAVGEFSACSAKIGASIFINNRVRYVSDGIKWDIPQPKKPKLALPKPSPFLPKG